MTEFLNIREYFAAALNLLLENTTYSIVFACVVAIATIASVGVFKGLLINRIPDKTTKNTTLIMLSMIFSSAWTAVFDWSENIEFTYYFAQCVATGFATTALYFFYEHSNARGNVNTLVKFFFEVLPQAFLTGIKKCVVAIIASFGNKNVAKKSISSVFNDTANSVVEKAKTVKNELENL